MGQHIIATSLEQVANFVGSSQLVAFDTETTGLNTRIDTICGIGMSPNGVDGIYVPCNHVYAKNYVKKFDSKETLYFVRNLLDKKGIFIHNAKYDAEIVYQNSGHSWDMWKTNKVIDTMILAYMMGRYHGVGLKSLTKLLFDYDMHNLEDLFGGKKANIHCERLTVEQIVDYACEDPIYTYQLAMYLLPKIKESPMRTMCHVELELVKYVEKMERTGVLLDAEHLKIEADKINELYKFAESLVFKEVSEKLGQPVEFDINSPQDVAEIFFDHMGLPVVGLTPTGKRSTDQKTLNKLAAKYSIVRNVLTAKRLTKSSSSFLEMLPKHVESDGRIHSSFLQHGAPSGRFSSADPNLQNMPVVGRDPFKLVVDGVTKEFDTNVRNAFVATPGYYFVDPDYSQIEYKILVGEAGETSFIRAFDEGVDFHTHTAKLIGKDRATAKTTNFRLQYMGGPQGLAEALEISLAEAKEIIRVREESMPAVGVYRQNALLNMRRSGYVQTRFGRRRYDDGVYSKDGAQRAFTERSLYNTLIQGAAADVLKMGMVKLGKLIDERYGEDWVKVRMLLTVHDEILLEVRNDVPVNEIFDMCKEAMEIQIDGWPKITIEAKVGTRWGDMKKMDSENKQITTSVAESPHVEQLTTPVIPSNHINSEQIMPVIGGKKVILQPKEQVTQEKLLSLIKLMDERPGVNLFVVKMDSKDYELGKHRTALDESNAGLINTVLSCSVAVDAEDVNVESLLAE